jgi:hypothetical protein
LSRSHENGPHLPPLFEHIYDALFDRLEQRLGEEVARAELDRQAVRGLLADLLERDRPGQLEAVREEARYRSPALIQALLAGARDRRPARVAEAFHWARLAYEATAPSIELAEPRPFDPRLAASLRRASLLEIAETLRLAGKLRWAALCLQALAADPRFGCDPDEHAQLCITLARICRARGRGSRALGLYMRAVALFGEIGDFAAAARVRREMRTLLGSLSD